MSMGNVGENGAITIVFEADRKRAAAYRDRECIGECVIGIGFTRWVIQHTHVRPGFEGQGIAKKLVLKVVEEARKQQIKLTPVCPYAKKLLTGKEEYSDVLG